MAKFIARFTTIFTAIYFMAVFYLALFLDKVWFNDFYIVLLELCLYLFLNESKSYHCKYIRWTALGILIFDILSRLDYRFEVLPLDSPLIYLPAIIFCIFTSISLVLAIKHFIRVININLIRNENIKRKN